MMSKVDNIEKFKVLVTGCCGFLGAALVKALLEKGAFVVGVDTKPSFPKHHVAKSLLENFRFITGDIFQTLNKVPKLFTAAARDKSAVFHFAGMAHTDQCERHPDKAFQSNVLLTQQMLEFCRVNKLNKFIFPSTGIVYGDRLESPAKEEDPTVVTNFYTTTKLTAETLIRGYAEGFKLPCIIARLSNIYGPSANPDTVVATIVKQGLKGEAICVRDLTPVRDFIYIADVVEGFLRLLVSTDSDKFFLLLNLSTGIGYSVQEIADLTKKLIPNLAIITQKNKLNIQQTSKVVLDNSLLSEMLRWRPKYSLSKGLSLTLEFYKSNDSYQ